MVLGQTFGEMQVRLGQTPIVGTVGHPESCTSSRLPSLSSDLFSPGNSAASGYHLSHHLAGVSSDLWPYLTPVPSAILTPHLFTLVV